MSIYLRRLSLDQVSTRPHFGLPRKELKLKPSRKKDAFFSSLPRGGEAETTLDYRLKGVPVWAKTGSLEYVRTLSGYVRTADGRMMAFSLLANNYTVPSYRITQAMDRIVLAMTESVDV